MGKKPGRPTKLNPELQEEICKHLRDGLFRCAAAALVGIDEQTLSRWWHRGASEAKGPFREFHLAVNKAEAEYMAAAHRTLDAASTANPKHLQFLLSRRFPHLYGRRDNVEMQNPEDKAQEQEQARAAFMERLCKFLPDAAEPATAPAAPVPPAEPPSSEPVQFVAPGQVQHVPATDTEPGQYGGPPPPEPTVLACETCDADLGADGLCPVCEVG